MRFTALLAALALLAACQTTPPPAQPQARAVDRATRIELPPPQGYAVSADNERVLFSLNVAGVANVFSAPITGGDAEALTNSISADTYAVSYFPNDDRVLLMSGLHLMVRERDGATRDLGDGLQFVSWRDDGGAFYVVGSAILQIDAANYQRKNLLNADGADAVVISRDGRWAALLRGEALFLADLSAPNPSPQPALTGQAVAALYEFAPDSASLVFGIRRNGFIAARSYVMATGDVRAVMDAHDANVLTIASSSSGRYAVYATGDDTPNDVVAVNQQTDRAIPLARGARDMRFTRDESRVVFRLADDGWPQDIFTADITGEHINRIVHIAGAAR